MSTSGEEQVVVSGFTVVPVKFSAESSAGHYLYLKEHSAGQTNPDKPRDRTLFVLNVPPYCTEACLRRVFSKVGKVQNVFLHKTPSVDTPAKNESEFFPTVQPITGFKVAYIVFTKASSVQRAKKLPYNQSLILSTTDAPLVTGLQKWCDEYKAAGPQAEKLREEVTEYMANYDKRLEEKIAHEKEDDGVPDSDGWITVTRHGRHQGAPHTEAQQRKVTAKERKKRQRKELLNFYAFQIRESKKEKIAELRQKFEEDKQKIALMKASRKFRPY